MFEGLSLDQAPPLSAVIRFFITLPLFGLILSLMMIGFPAEVMIPNHPYSLASVHLFFLGIATMGMIGAMFQMQSVLGGKPIPYPLGNAVIIHTFLSVGTITLAGAFITAFAPLFVIAAVLLAAALVYFALIIFKLLSGSITHDTLKGMKFAVISLGVTAILGVIMASAYANGEFSSQHTALRSLHYSFGLMGWMALLVIYVAFQVVEMFYVTSPYSHWCKHNVSRIILTALLLKVLWLFASLPYGWILDGAIGALLLGFIATTAKRLQERKRRVSDVSIWFWRMGLGLLSLSILSYIGAYFSQSFEMVTLIAFGAFVLAIILGMMGKIIPFLVWYHLSSSGYMDAPIMSHIIPSKRLKATFWLFAAMAAFTLFSVLWTPMLMAAGSIGVLMFSLVLFNIVSAWRLYRHTLTHGTRFEMGEFSV